MNAAIPSGVLVLALLAGLDNQPLLERLAAEDAELQVRAVLKLTDQELPATYAAADQPVELRRSAVRNLRDAERLRQLAKDDPDAEVRHGARLKLRQLGITTP